MAWLFLILWPAVLQFHFVLPSAPAPRNSPLGNEHSQGGCSSPDNGGCSQLCIPRGPGAWRCSCFPGYALHQDGKRCVASGADPRLHHSCSGEPEAVQSLSQEGLVRTQDGEPIQSLKGSQSPEAWTPPSGPAREDQNSVRELFQDCPPSHDAYCLHGGQCIYIEVLQESACRCLVGYHGPRCEYLDLHFRSAQPWQLGAGTVAAACLGALLLLLLLLLGALYYHRTQKLHLSSAKNPLEASLGQGGAGAAGAPPGPQPWFVVLKEHQDLTNERCPDPLKPGHGAEAGQQPLPKSGPVPLAK